MTESFESAQEPKAESTKVGRPKHILVTATVAVVIVVVVLLAVMLSPQYSPLASIHDADDDGVADSDDAFPDDASETADTDEDGYGDNCDCFPEDDEEWEDSDEDGVGDNGDEFPEDSNEWEDTDGDGYGDNGDEFPDDPDEWNDTDGDGIGDNSDAFPNDTLNSALCYTFTVDEILIGFGALCINALADILWNDLMINLSDGTDIASWDDIRSEDFPDYYWSLPVGILNLGGYDIKLIAWETQNDDYLSVGDYLMFKFEESIPENVTYSVSITSKSTGAELAYFDLSAAM